MEYNNQYEESIHKVTPYEVIHRLTMYGWVRVRGHPCDIGNGLIKKFIRDY